MRRPSAVCLLLAVALPLAGASPGAAADRGTLQGSPRPAVVKVTVDTSEVPELAGWGRGARDLVRKWYPLIGDQLQSDRFHSSR